MDGFKLASVAGMVTMAASVFVEFSLPTLVQVGQPQTQPGLTQPGTPLPERGQPDLTRPAQRGQTESLFQLRDPNNERALNELRDELSRIEKQMRETNERLLRQLGQVRLLEGERKIDALAEVVQGILHEHVEMENYLTRVRESLTGRGMTPALGIDEPALPDLNDDEDDDDEDDDDDDSPDTPGSDDPSLP